jgi:hypothetical protein
MRLAFSLAWWALSVAWLFNFGWTDQIPFWVIIIGHLILLKTRPGRAEMLAPPRKEPSFLVWLVEGFAMVGSLGGVLLFAISSGLVFGHYELNWVAKSAVALVCLAISCLWFAGFLERRDL